VVVQQVMLVVSDFAEELLQYKTYETTNYRQLSILQYFKTLNEIPFFLLVSNVVI